jgi:hypothetical protein
MQISQEIGAQEVGLLLSEANFEHGPNYAMKALYIDKTANFTT